MAYERNKQCSDEMKELIKDGRKKFVRVNEGAVLYSMGVNSFRQLAVEAKAVYHIKKTVLINIRLIDDYLEHFRDEEQDEANIKAIKDVQSAANYMDLKAGLITEKEYEKMKDSVMEVKAGKSREMER